MPEAKKILVIEDEKAMAHALEIKLIHSGFEVRIAANGEEGLAMLEKEDFSLVLLDLIMPKLDGFKILEKMKNSGSKIPIIVMSNLSQAQDETRVRELGAAEFFIKSDTPLAKIVEQVKISLGI
jgi:DNA-binding response OmpR family regulator